MANKYGDVVVYESFISDEESDRIVEFLDPIAALTPRPNSYTALGWPNSAEAAKVGETTAIADYTGNEKIDATIDLIGNTFHRIKEDMERYFNSEMGLVQGFYQRLDAGGFMELHSDTTDLDGSPLSEDGTPEENEWSAVLYLGNYNEDFTGGEIEFPKQEFTLEPTKGMLVYFRGDQNHPHKVSEVLSGKRRTIVFFYGPRGRNSERIFYDH